MANSLDMNITRLLITRGEGVITSLFGIYNSDLSFIAIENLSNLFKSWALCLDVEEYNEDELEKDPDLVYISIRFAKG